MIKQVEQTFDIKLNQYLVIHADMFTNRFVQVFKSQNLQLRTRGGDWIQYKPFSLYLLLWEERAMF